MSKRPKPERLTTVRLLLLVVFVHAIPVFAQPAPIVVTVDECLPPLTAALATASGPRPDGACSYFWTLARRSHHGRAEFRHPAIPIRSSGHADHDFSRSGGALRLLRGRARDLADGPGRLGLGRGHDLSRILHAARRFRRAFLPVGSGGRPERPAIVHDAGEPDPHHGIPPDRRRYKRVPVRQLSPA